MSAPAPAPAQDLPADPPLAARARGLTKAYGSGGTAVLALDSVDVDIARGRFTAVMGPSGSGKSTLMLPLADAGETPSLAGSGRSCPWSFPAGIGPG